jgi:hypothetical protein
MPRVTDARLAMAEFDHVCLRRPCLFCAIDRGDHLPPGTRPIDTIPLKILPWRERDDAPDVRRIALEVAGLSQALRAAAEQFVDELVTYAK